MPNGIDLGLIDLRSGVRNRGGYFTTSRYRQNILIVGNNTIMVRPS